MTEELSTFFDEECSELEHEELLDRLCEDPALQRKWRRYRLADSFFRGDCTNSYLKFAMTRDLKDDSMQHIHTSEFPPYKNPIRSPSIPHRRLNLPLWLSGMGLAAGIGTAAVLGFFVSKIMDVPTVMPSGAAVATITTPRATNWQTNYAVLVDSEEFGANDFKILPTASSTQSIETDPERHLNQALLNHPSNWAYVNGMSNLAKLVSYQY